MEKSAKIKELLEANPIAREQIGAVEDALKLMKKIRALGVTPTGYGLESPYGDRSLIRKASVCRQNRRLV